MVLQCDWAQIQVIVLTNDGNGFGFGISGSRNSGAVVRNIFPGCAADRDGSLQNGDHLLAVGDVRLWGMGAEQVASILRQAGQDSIRLVVARPIDPSIPQFAINSTIIPTKVLTDPVELERTIESGLQTPNGFTFDSVIHPCEINLQPPDSASSSASFSAAPIIVEPTPLIPSSSSFPHVPAISTTLIGDSTFPLLKNPPTMNFIAPMDTMVTQHSALTKVTLISNCKTKAVVHNAPSTEAPLATNPSLSISSTSVESKDKMIGILRVVETTKNESDNKNYLSSEPSLGAVLPEKEEYSIELTKDSNGLGITVAGYICEKDLCGIFVKSVIEGSMADRSGCIMVNDQVVEVDGISLAGYTNHEAVEILKQTASIVKLKIIRYLRGLKFEEFHESRTSGAEEEGNKPSTVGTVGTNEDENSLKTATRTSSISNNESSTARITDSVTPPPPLVLAPNQSIKTSSSSFSLMQPRSPIVRHSVPEIALKDDIRTLTGNDISAASVDAIDGKKAMIEDSESKIMVKWEAIVGPKFTIVIAKLKKPSEESGLGISLEGTVDVEDGREVRPHHYIRSVLPYGPIGKHGGLRSGDELLEVNGKSLKGLFHEEVVKTLKELPLNVCLICARKIFNGPSPIRGTIVGNVDTGRSKKAFQSRKILSGSLQSLLALKEPELGLMKAKSEVSLAYTTSTSLSVHRGRNSDSRTPSSSAGSHLIGKRQRARSLDPLTDKPAMWSKSVEEIVLVKNEKGLGFSILDYQDPMNSSETVIVVRSLVPGGVAQTDCRVVPGDRIMFVNDTQLEHSSLDTAVQALKGASLGPVRIGISRPLPLEHSSSTEDKSPMNRSEGVKIGNEDVGALYRSSLSTYDGESEIKTEFGSIPLRESWTGDDDTIPDCNEGSDSHSFSSSSSAFIPYISSDPAPSRKRELPESLRGYPILRHLPKYQVSLKKSKNEPLGLELEALAFELCGTVVRAVDGGGAVAKSEYQLRPGDLILSLNNESLWRVRSSQAKLILQRADSSLNTTIVFVPEEDLVAEEDISREPDCSERNKYNLKGEEEEENTLSEEESLSESLKLSFVTKTLQEKHIEDEEIVPDLTVQSASIITHFPLDLQESSVDPPLSSTLKQNTVTSSSASTLEDDEELIWDKNSIKEERLMVRIYQPPPDIRDKNNEGGRGPMRNSTSFNGKTSPGMLSTSSSSTFGQKPSGYNNDNNKTCKPVLKAWGAERRVEIMRVQGSGLGISIVGGKVDVSGSNNSSGIFIKNVLPESPAGRTQQLYTGDKVVQVGSIRITSADHDAAVKAIKSAGNPVIIVVQSLVPAAEQPPQSIPRIYSTSEIPRPPTEPTINNPSPLPIPEPEIVVPPTPPIINDPSTSPITEAEMVVPPTPRKVSTPGLIDPRLLEEKESIISIVSEEPSRPSTPEIIQPGLSHLERQAIQQKIRVEIQSQKEDHLTVYKKNSLDIDEGSEHKSVSMEIETARAKDDEGIDAKKLKDLEDDEEEEESSEDEVEFKEENINITENFKCLQGEVVELRLRRNNFGFGMALSGHRDRNRMSTFICGLHPEGPAKASDKLMVGDELLKFHKTVVRGRCHLNVSAIIKKTPADIPVRVIVLRNIKNSEKIAVNKIVHFPSVLDDNIFKAPEFSKYRAKREVNMQKTTEGLGIMLIEGHHKVTGKGIFVSDIQEGSLANKGGMKVGDMLLAVNTESFLESNYDQAVAIIKNLTGRIRMLVTNPQDAAKEIERENDEHQRRGSIVPPPAESKTPQKTLDKPEVSPPKAPETAKTLSPSTPAAPPTAATPAKTPVKTPAKSPAKVDSNKIEIKTDSAGLGISLLGGTDTPMGGIVVYEIYGNGAAEKDGRLRIGDRLVSVNGVQCKTLTNAGANKLIRSNMEKVTFVVDRTCPWEDLFEEVEVELNKKPGKGFGLSIVGKKSGRGVFISDLVTGGIAESTGSLYRGDQLISINDKDLSEMEQDKAVAILKTTAGNVKLKVRRLKAFQV
nr:multiple PDZ domain protein-like isoform X2 [Lepeophtheirus salmonis]